MFTEKNREEVIRNQRPDDMDLRVKIQEERDFMISQALQEGQDGSEIFAINQLPDEYFIKIIEKRQNKN